MDCQELLRGDMQTVGEKILHNGCGLSIRHTLTSYKCCKCFVWNCTCFVSDEHMCSKVSCLF
jgi:hypothetical protein